MHVLVMDALTSHAANLGKHREGPGRRRPTELLNTSPRQVAVDLASNTCREDDYDCGQHTLRGRVLCFLRRPLVKDGAAIGLLERQCANTITLSRPRHETKFLRRS
jgi:hypothetical protein